MDLEHKILEENHAQKLLKDETDLDSYIENLVNTKLNEKLGFIVAENKELKEKVSSLEIHCAAQTQLNKDLQEKLDNFMTLNREADLASEVKEINEKIMKMSSESKGYFESNSSVVYHNWIEMDGRINVIVEDIEHLEKKSKARLGDFKIRLKNLEENIVTIKEKLS